MPLIPHWGSFWAAVQEDLGCRPGSLYGGNAHVGNHRTLPDAHPAQCMLQEVPFGAIYAAGIHQPGGLEGQHRMVSGVPERWWHREPWHWGD